MARILAITITCMILVACSDDSTAPSIDGDFDDDPFASDGDIDGSTSEKDDGEVEGRDNDPDLDENPVDGDMTDGDVIEGDVTDGDAVDGDEPVDGDVDGDMTDGDMTDGDYSDGDPIDADLEADPDLDDDNETEQESPLTECHISHIEPQGMGIGEEITIVGSGFGEAPGLMTITGLRVDDPYWSDEEIRFVIPEGANSGLLRVLTTEGQCCLSEAYRVNYRKDIEDDFKISHPDEFNLKDVGFFSAATLIESEPGWMYLYAATSLSTLDTTQAEPRRTSILYTPSKATNLMLFGEHVFMTGSFGLRAYAKADLQSPTDGGANTIDPRAAFSGVLFKDADARTFPPSERQQAGQTIVAAIEFSCSHESCSAVGSRTRIYLFSWDEEEETLDLISIIEDQHLEGKVLYGVVIDPLNPKLYVGECDRTLAPLVEHVCNIHEFSLDDLQNRSWNGSVWINQSPPADANRHIIGDMESSGNKLWISLYGAGQNDKWPMTVYQSPNRFRAFMSYKLDPDGLPEYGAHVDACTVGLRDFDCVGNDDCKDVYEKCEGDRCVCMEGWCQVCNLEHISRLDIIPEDGLVVGSTGMSFDYHYIHNVFLFDLDPPEGQHLPLSSSESIDWVFDISGYRLPDGGGEIAIADEWTNSLILSYDGPPNVSIEHHAEESWDEPTRMFSPGWFPANSWEHNGRIYSGSSALMSADLSALSDYTKWRVFNQEQHSPYTPHTGAHRPDGGPYIFGKGVRENFAVTRDGAYLMLFYENPATREIKLLNDPMDNHYVRYEGATCQTLSYPEYGSALWIDDYVGLTAAQIYQNPGFPQPDYNERALYAYYIDPERSLEQSCSGDEDCQGQDPPHAKCIEGRCRYGVIEQRTAYEDLAPREGYTNIIEVTDGTYALGRTWAGFLLCPPPDFAPGWTDLFGGLRFVNISYPDGGPPVPDNPDREIRIETGDPATVNSLYGWKVESMDISDDGWILIVALKVSYSWLLGWWESPLDRRVVVFRYEDISTMNEECSHPSNRTGEEDEATCLAQLDRLSIPYENYVPQPHDTAHQDAVFWGNDQYVAVAVRRGEGVTNQVYKDGIHIFRRDDFSHVYYYPGGYDSKNTIYPFQYTAYKDINVYLPLRPSRLLTLDDGDLLVFSESGNIARLGAPGND